MLPRGVRALEALSQPRAGQHTVKIVPVEVDDDALIRDGLVDERLVDGVVPHEQHIPRAQGVYLVLHGVVHAAGDEQHYLVKIVKVKIPLLSGGIAQVKIVVVLLKITLARKGLFLFHRVLALLFFVYYTAFFAMFQEHTVFQLRFCPSVISSLPLLFRANSRPARDILFPY